MPYRLALITPEYVTEPDPAGGTAEAMRKIAAGFRALGHTVEVFVSSSAAPDAFEHEGVRINRVGNRISSAGVCLRVLASRPGDWAHWYAAATGRPRGAINLADGFARRHAEDPFDAIISTELDGAAALIRTGAPTTHLVRIATSLARTDALPRERPFSGPLLRALYRASLRRGDRLFAPSHRTAEAYKRRFDREVGVIRTPVDPGIEARREDVPPGLPPRYLVHAGRIGRAKGSEELAAALNGAWRREPELTMVWAGREAERNAYRRCASNWARENESRVEWLGPLERSELYAVLSRAVATVVPDNAENFPNVAIESLALGVPVIVSADSAVAEIVTNGEHAVTVSPDDPNALAETLARAWRGEPPFDGRRSVPPAVEEMTVSRAGAQLLSLAGLSAPGPTQNAPAAQLSPARTAG